MKVDVQTSLFDYCRVKTSRPAYSSFKVSMPCDVCHIHSDASLLNPVTIDKAVYFCCADCCEKFLLTDYAHLTFDELKRVLDL